MQPPGPGKAPKRRRKCEDFAPPDEGTRPSGRGGANKCPGEAPKRRRKCEDFAPHNEGIRPSGERGANKSGRRDPGRRQRGGGNMKILLPDTKAQGLAGNGEQINSAAAHLCWRPPLCKVFDLGQGTPTCSGFFSDDADDEIHFHHRHQKYRTKKRELQLQLSFESSMK